MVRPQGPQGKVVLSDADGTVISKANPFPSDSTPEIVSGNLSLVASARLLDALLDVLERIQQQLAMINEGENLRPGERHYGNS